MGPEGRGGGGVVYPNRGDSPPVVQYCVHSRYYIRALRELLWTWLSRLGTLPNWRSILNLNALRDVVVSGICMQQRSPPLQRLHLQGVDGCNSPHTLTSAFYDVPTASVPNIRPMQHEPTLHPCMTFPGPWGNMCWVVSLTAHAALVFLQSCFG